MGISRHLFWRALPTIGFALASALFVSGSIAADPVRVAVQGTFVESIEIIVIDTAESGTSDQGLAIKSSPGREFTVLADPAGEDLTVSYQ